MSSAMMTTKFGRAGGGGVELAGEWPHPGPMARRPSIAPATREDPRPTAGNTPNRDDFTFLDLCRREPTGGLNATFLKAPLPNRGRSGACSHENGAGR